MNAMISARPPWSVSIFPFPSTTAGPRLAVITTRSVRSRRCLLELSWYRWHFSGHVNYGDVDILTNVGMVQSMIHGIVTKQFSLMWQSLQTVGDQRDCILQCRSGLWQLLMSKMKDGVWLRQPVLVPMLCGSFVTS
jgi:hypothetical protein